MGSLIFVSRLLNLNPFRHITSKGKTVIVHPDDRPAGPLLEYMDQASFFHVIAAQKIHDLDISQHPLDGTGASGANF